MNDSTLQLLEKLKLGDCPERKEDFTAYFEDIAELLMKNFVIEKGSERYEIVETEFYLYTAEHPDVITYPRAIGAGRWYFHQSGVDLTFESTAERFGGILIRGLRDTADPSHQIFGPMKCMEALWDNFNALSNTQGEYPILAPAKLQPGDIKPHPRWINIPSDKRAARIAYWKSRIAKGTALPTVADQDLECLVFTSPYRFIKPDSINLTHESWTKYTAKPKMS